MHVAKRGHRAPCYLCTRHRTRGVTGCANALGEPIDGLHADVADRLEHKLLAPVVVEAALLRDQELWTHGDDGTAERERLEREAAWLEAELARSAEAVFAGGRVARSAPPGDGARPATAAQGLRGASHPHARNCPCRRPTADCSADSSG